MYRERKGVDTHTSIPLDRLGTPQQISSYIKKLIKASQYDFHETEPVVVSKVYLNDTGLQGAINGKFSVSGDEVDEVFPLMPHIHLREYYFLTLAGYAEASSLLLYATIHLLLLVT